MGPIARALTFLRHGFSRLCRSHGGSPDSPEPWNGHRTSSGLSLAFRSRPRGLRPRAGQGLVTSAKDSESGQPHSIHPQSSPTDLIIEPMGSQQYSCRLRLSRRNLYILYINRATEPKPPSRFRFCPQPQSNAGPDGPCSPLESFDLKTPGLHPPEAIPKVDLPARAGAKSLLLKPNVGERGSRFGATA